MAEQNRSKGTGKQADVNTGLHIPLDWQIPDSVVTRFATNIVVQRGEHEYIISFFEVKPPIIFGETEAVEARLSELKTIPAICVARIVVSVDRMPGFVQALTANLEQQENSNGTED